MSKTEKYITHVDNIDLEKIKSIFNNMEEDNKPIINLYTCKDKIDSKTNKPKKKKCVICKKKVGLLGYECKCGNIYCSLHRMPEDHQCKIDYKTEGKDKLRVNNPLIINDKINNRI